MHEELAELGRYRDLLRMLVARELKVRYKNSVLGFAWSIVPPLLQVLVFSFVARGFGAQVHNYGAYLLCGLIPWTFFSTATLDASMSLLVNYPIIRKIYFPRETIPLAYVISNFVHFMMGWAVYFTAFLVVLPLFGRLIHSPEPLGIPLLPRMLWFPVITCFEVVLVTGLALWVSALNVFYEDVKFILTTVFQLAFFVIPLLVPADVIWYSSSAMRAHPWLFKLYMLNPITAFIDAYRHMLLEPPHPEHYNATLMQGRIKPPPPLPMQWDTFIGACLISVVVAYSGYWYFNRRKWLFVEKP
jgi:ABC-type polysaccharide/polyol phosphate export permease